VLSEIVAELAISTTSRASAVVLVTLGAQFREQVVDVLSRMLDDPSTPVVRADGGGEVPRSPRHGTQKPEPSNI